MKIYTKTGDKGDTSLFGGKRIRKNHIRVEAYGTVDELISFLGLAKSFLKDNTKEIKPIIENIQNQLFQLAAELASPDNKKKEIQSVEQKEILYLEQTIDEIEQNLEPLKSFIIPGENKLSSILHICRTIARRCERIVVGLDEHEKVSDEILIYLNRVNDLLFVLARYADKLERCI